jgi:hypothetical protein
MKFIEAILQIISQIPIFHARWTHGVIKSLIYHNKIKLHRKDERQQIDNKML